MIPLAAFEEIIDASGVAPRIEAMLPAGVRRRQLTVRTLLAGMCLTQADGRPAHLTRVHQALVSLPGDDQRRLGVLADWKHGPHLLTYRQTEYAFGLAAAPLGKDEPDGLPPGPLQRVCDDLLEAGIAEEFKNGSQSLAVDWTDLESFSRPPPRGTSDCADPEASWGHRKNNLLRSQDELFYGCYLSAGIMVPEENGPAVPELARRATVSSPRHDPVRAFAPVLTAMPGQGIPPGDILDDSGYAHRDAAAWAVPLRTAGAQLVQDLHPHDRGPKGTRHGAIIANGNLCCPQTPRPLLELGPLARTATKAQAADHDRQTSELARYKLGRLTRDDADGYHRVQCPAAMGKIRCPLRPSSMTLDRGRPEILSTPGHPQACCTQQTLTVPADVLAKTAQKHDYPSAAWRRSYARRTGAGRGFATTKDPATSDITRGWCRLMGLAPLMLFTTSAWIIAKAASSRDSAAASASVGLSLTPAPVLRQTPSTGTMPPSHTVHRGSPAADSAGNSTYRAAGAAWRCWPTRRPPRCIPSSPAMSSRARRSSPTPGWAEPLTWTTPFKWRPLTVVIPTPWRSRAFEPKAPESAGAGRTPAPRWCRCPCPAGGVAKGFQVELLATSGWLLAACFRRQSLYPAGARYDPVSPAAAVWPGAARRWAVRCDAGLAAVTGGPGCNLELHVQDNQIVKVTSPLRLFVSSPRSLHARSKSCRSDIPTMAVIAGQNRPELREYCHDRGHA